MLLLDFFSFVTTWVFGFSYKFDLFWCKNYFVKKFWVKKVFFGGNFFLVKKVFFFLVKTVLSEKSLLLKFFFGEIFFLNFFLGEGSFW